MTEPPRRIDPNHPSVAARRLAVEDALAAGLRADPLGKADCCSAEAHFRAVLPATGQRRHDAELFLCGHHARACRAKLDRAGALVYDEWGLPA